MWGEKYRVPLNNPFFWPQDWPAPGLWLYENCNEEEWAELQSWLASGPNECYDITEGIYWVWFKLSENKKNLKRGLQEMFKRMQEDPWKGRSIVVDESSRPPNFNQSTTDVAGSSNGTAGRIRPKS